MLSVSQQIALSAWSLVGVLLLCIACAIMTVKRDSHTAERIASRFAVAGFAVVLVVVLVGFLMVRHAQGA